MNYPQKAMRRRGLGLGIILLLALVVVAAGCRTGRLRGENYDASAEPYIRRNVPADVITTGDRVAYRVILVGDTGEPVPDDPTLAAIGRWAVPQERAAVVLLGDNLYPDGLTADDRARGEAILRQQLAATSALRIFVPGNHDWGPSPQDWTGAHVVAQQEFVLAWPEGDVDFLPRDGCAGPAVRELLKPGDGLEQGIAVVAIDWMPWFSPVADPSKCPDGDFGTRIDAAFSALKRHFVIVVSHFPLRSGGTRAGFSRGFIIDRFIDFYHLLGLRPPFDMYHPQYMVLAEQVQDALARHRPLVYAAGHDHSLQLFEADEVARMYIVSGAGSAGKVSPVTAVAGTIFAHAVPGFAVLDFAIHDGVDTPVVRIVRTGQEVPVFQMRIP
ncbi:MAG: metallophosphoesterase [Acidobacteria bacterium]|nr:metallophosphoesterase [Acidobacteriota bacterium]